MMWVNNGNINATMFHNSGRMSKHRNSIFLIMDQNGDIQTDRILTKFSLNIFPIFGLILSITLFLISSPGLKFLKNLCHSLLESSSGHMVLMSSFINSLGMTFKKIFIVLLIIFNNACMPISSNLTYVVLIPKKENPKVVLDFCLIFLCNVCYKIIAKILAERLKSVLPNLIRKEQTGFIQIRSPPAHNIITIQEVVHSLYQDYSYPLG